MANYTLGQSNGGPARRTFKEYGMIPSLGGKVSRGYAPKKRTHLPKWLRGVKGFMDCGKEEKLANQKNSENELK